MIFKKINQTTVQCVLSEEEMHHYGIRLEDFLLNQEKSRDFLNLLVDMAGKEVGYHTHSGVMSMQIIRLPDHHLAIIMSENQPGAVTPEMLEAQQDDDNFGQDETAEQEIDNLLHNLSDHALNLIQEELKKNKDTLSEDDQKPLSKKKRTDCVYCFSDFHVLEQLSAAVSLKKPVSSVLFRDPASHFFYLYVKKGRLKIAEYDSLCEMMGEYGALASEAPYALAYCKEHFEGMIPKNALKTIGKIAGVYPVS
jgi:adapter protein MecA 1/2